MEKTNQTETSQSLPNVRKASVVSLDIRRILSLSLSQIKKHAEFAEYHHKPSPFVTHPVFIKNSRVGNGSSKREVLFLLEAND